VLLHSRSDGVWKFIGLNSAIWSFNGASLYSVTRTDGGSVFRRFVSDFGCDYGDDHWRDAVASDSFNLYVCRRSSRTPFRRSTRLYR